MVSVILVHYRVEKEIYTCISSLLAQKAHVPFEIIVIDNDEVPTIAKQLVKQFPKVRYIKSPTNSGYSGGNNLGALHAKGEYLFFLNPDTKLVSNCIDTLVSFLKQHKNAGAVAPLLLDKQDNPLHLQGSRKLSFFASFITQSFVNKWFPTNPISRDFFQTGWDKTKIKEMEIVPGTAFMIRKDLFEKIGRFDQRYFLFFEEYDFCRRLTDAGYINYIIPLAKLIHYWGNSTAKRTDIETIFKRSRYLYFEKFYGMIPALLLTSFLGISLMHLVAALIIGISGFLRVYTLETSMTFIGDFAWFYLSAKEMLSSGNVPLVGIASSHPWIHQGALWTYLLAPALVLGNFNPLAGGYLAAGIGVLTTALLFFITKEMYGKHVAFFTTFFYATSPLVIMHARMPYHTAPIPLFVLLYLYAVYKWVKGSTLFFMLSFLFITILYNLELATSVLIGPFIITFFYGVITKKSYVLRILQWRILLGSIILFSLPMTAMIIYDVTHYFGQTFGYIAWLFYRVALLFGYPSLHPSEIKPSLIDFFSFLYKQQTVFYYASNPAISLLICGGSFVALLKKYKSIQYLLLALFIFIPLAALIMSKTPSEAYVPMLFIQLGIAVGILFESLISIRHSKKIAIYALVFLICLVNALTFVTLTHLESGAYTKKVAAAKEIIEIADSEKFRLVSSKNNNQFHSFIMPYEYLLWWMGKPTTENASLVIEVGEDTAGIHIKKRNK